MLLNRTAFVSSAALLLVALPLVVAHGDDAAPAMEMGGAHSVQSSATVNGSEAAAIRTFAPTYFHHPEYKGWLYAHIGLMILAWTVVLPVAVFLSAARTRLAIPVQFSFLIINALGVFTSIVYDARTPDLYENNAHHKIGWVVTWIAIVWVLLGLLNLINVRKEKTMQMATASQQMTSQTMAEYRRIQDYQMQQSHRWSDDSGHGSERTLYSDSRSSSADNLRQKLELPEVPEDQDLSEFEQHQDEEQRGFLNNSTVDRLLSRKSLNLSAGRTLTALNILYVVLERVQLLLAFLAICTGAVTWGGLFIGHDEIFSGLAHWIKGGIFFWYGLLTLGRWMGAFADFGWAWNVRPKHPLVSKFAARLPSAEFTESFVIFFYGASNVFLEHLNAWGKEWSAQDLEHISITVMFFGGGLLGMLIESETARNLLNTNILIKQEEGAQHIGMAEAQREEWETPKTYRTSLNPMPGLVILLLGIMMSSHHQHSMVSTMIHAQWGSLFVGFALARGVTYILLYISPPSSHFPSRPPSEIIAAFCLISGGLIFMASAKDTVLTLELNHLDAMFIFTVMMGLTCIIMAWTVGLYAIKGWASRRESKLPTSS